MFTSIRPNNTYGTSITAAVEKKIIKITNNIQGYTETYKSKPKLKKFT